MKKLFTLLILLFIQNINAQIHVPIDEYDGMWDYLQGHSSGTDIWYSGAQQITENDTIINNIAYKKHYRRYASDNLQLLGFIREDSSKRVYYHPLEPYCPNDTIVEYLLYDFSLEVGDTLKIIMPNTLSNPCLEPYLNIEAEIVAVDSIMLLNGDYRKRLKFKEGVFGLYTHFYIEGIGSTIDLVYIFNVTALDGWHDWDALVCYLVQDSILFHDEFWGEDQCFLDPSTNIEEVVESDQVKIFPNPGTHFITIGTESKITDELIIDFIDINGRLITSKNIFPNQQLDIAFLQNGFYIISIKSGERKLTPPNL